MSPSKTSGRHRKMDVVPEPSAGRIAKKIISTKETTRNKGTYAVELSKDDINLELLAELCTAYIVPQKPHAVVEQNLLDSVNSELTEEELDIAKTAARLSATEGLSSGEDHITRIKTILSVG